MKLKKILAIALSVCTMLSSFSAAAFAMEKSDTETEQLENLALGKKYSYSYPGALAISGDTALTNLTDGKPGKGVPGDEGWSMFKVTNVHYERYPANGGKFRDFYVFDDIKPNFYVKTDLNFVQDVNEVILSTSVGNGAKPLSGVEVFISDDGYNYNTYPAQTVTKFVENGRIKYRAAFDKTVKAKGVMVVVKAPVDYIIAMDELEVLGKSNNESKLISKGIPYTWDASAVNADNGGKQLTDGIISAFTKANYMTFDDAAAARMSSSRKDPVTGLNVHTITFTFPEEVNLNMLSFDAICNINGGGYQAALPDRAVVDYSTDGTNYTNFAETSGNGTSGHHENFFRGRFIVTRGETVKAKYVRLKVFVQGYLALDEVEIYGSDNAVSEIEHNYINRHDFYGQSNILRGKNYFNDEMLTDNKYRQKSQKYGKKADGGFEYVFETELDKYYPEICGATITTSTRGVNSFKVYVSEGGSDYKLVSGDYELNTETNMFTVAAYFDKVGADKIKIVLNTTADNIMVAEVQAFDEMPQLPLVRGGFFQLTTQQGAEWDPQVRNTDYNWYMQLKGMKELGMDYVVMQYGAEWNPQTGVKTCITDVPEDSKLYSYGYTKKLKYGCADPLTAIFKAADKLNMKVYLGTLYGEYDYWGYNRQPGKAEEVGQHGAALIDLLYNKYKDYKSLAGFYFADETCDQWLRMSSGVSTYRKIYEPQTAKVRALNPEFDTMISPAIWGGNSNETAGETSGAKLYDMIKNNEVEGGRPIIDIVSAQDCLGREATFTVSDNKYIEYEGNVSGWARFTEKAGAQFWTDAEVFENTNTTKRRDQVLKSLFISSRYTNGTIVFDIPHYYSQLCRYNQNDLLYFQNEYHLRETGKLFTTTTLGFADNLNNQPDNKVKIAGVKNNESVRRDVELRSSTSKATFTVKKGGKTYKTGVGKTITITEPGTYTATASRANYDTSDTITFTIDRTAPVISGAANGKTYTSPVQIGVNEECTFEVIKDDKVFFMPEDKKITSNGVYKITAIDKAGNKTSVTFTVDIAENTADRAELDKLISECDALNQDKYTAESWKVFADKYASYKLYAADEKLSQTDVDNLIKAITDAKNALVKISASVNFELKSYTKTENRFTREVSAEATSEEVEIIADEGVEYEVYADKFLKTKIDVVDSKYDLNIAKNAVTKTYIVVGDKEDGTVYEVVTSKKIDAPEFADIDGHFSKDAIEKMKYLGIVNGYEDGGKYLFMPDGNAQRDEACAMIMRYLGVDVTKFSNVDISGVYADYEKIADWALDYVKAAYALGIMGGKENENTGALEFCGEQKITRAEFSKIVYIAEFDGKTSDSEASFDDLSKEHWAYDYISNLYGFGIINGVGDNKFAPEDNVTRGEIIVMISRIVERNSK